jgi:hypothetical protein
LFVANSEAFAVEREGSYSAASDGVVGLFDSRGEVAKVEIALTPL